MADDAGAAEAGIVTLALNQQSAICHAAGAVTLGVA